MNLTINKAYDPILESSDRYYIVTGGRGSGKSYSVTWSILMLSFEIEQSIFYTRKTMASAQTSIIPDFKAVIDEWGIEAAFNITNDKITNIQSGSTITFMGLQTGSGENTAKAKGLSQATIWVLDEAEELTKEEDFNKWEFSVRSKRHDNKIILIMNPTTKEHFIYKRYFEATGVQPGSNLSKDNVTYIHTTYLDNIDNLDDNYIAELQKMQKRAPQQYELIILGGWRDIAEGVIFTNWTTGVTHDDLPTYYGYDDGFSPDPAALVECKVDKKRRTVYVKELMYDTSLIESEKCTKISRLIGTRICYADCASPSVIEAMRRRVGTNFKPAKKPAGSIIAGIEILRDYEMVIHPDSTNLIKELNNYVWNDRKSGTPIDRYNHLLDALRYIAFMEMKIKIVLNTGARFRR